MIDPRFLHQSQREAAQSPTKMPSKFHAPRQLKFAATLRPKVDGFAEVREQRMV